MLNAGERIHIITRRRFPEETRRHFVGEVEAASDTVARVHGYAFIYDSVRNTFVKRPEYRTRIIGLGGEGQIIHVLDRDLNLDDLDYTIGSDGRLLLTDGRGFELEINELGLKR